MDKQKQDSPSAHDILTQYIEQKSMRKTPERHEVLRVVSMMHGIFTIDELTQHMQQEARFQVSRATLFNTLELLCEAGLVIKHPLATAARYEFRSDDEPKSYVICRQCHTITRVPIGTARLTLSNMRVRYFNIEETLVYMHGLCRKCLARKRQEAKKRKKQTKTG